MNLTNARVEIYSFWSRCLKDAGPGVQARFKENMELFFEAVNQQTKDRDDAVIPDLESYIDVRRDTSGCKVSRVLSNVLECCLIDPMCLLAVFRSHRVCYEDRPA